MPGGGKMQLFSLRFPAMGTKGGINSFHINLILETQSFKQGI